MLRRVLLASFVEALANAGDEGARIAWRRHLALQRLGERDVVAVEGLLRLVILLHDSAVQVEAGEQAARARVSQDARLHRDVGVGRGFASDRTGSQRTRRAE